MSVYPYEVPINYFGTNSMELGGAAIIYKKEEKKKITGKGGCHEISIEEFLQCVKTTLVSTLEKSDIKCMIPALSYIDIDTTNLEYCNTTEDALGVNGLIYKSAQKIQVFMYQNAYSRIPIRVTVPNICILRWGFLCEKKVLVGTYIFCFFYRLRAYVVHFAIELYTTTEIILFLNLLWEMNAKFMEMAMW